MKAPLKMASPAADGSSGGLSDTPAKDAAVAVAGAGEEAAPTTEFVAGHDASNPDDEARPNTKSKGT